VLALFEAQQTQVAHKLSGSEPFIWNASDMFKGVLIWPSVISQTFAGLPCLCHLSATSVQPQGGMGCETGCSSMHFQNFFMPSLVLGSQNKELALLSELKDGLPIPFLAHLATDPRGDRPKKGGGRCLRHSMRRLPGSQGGRRAAEGTRLASRSLLQLGVLPCGQSAYRESAQLSVPSQAIVGTLLRDLGKI